MIWPVSEAQQRAELAKMWPLFPLEQGSPIHLRAIWGKGVPDCQPVKNITFTAARYPSVADRRQAFTDAAIRFNRRGHNIYTCFNLINPAFAGDEHNGLSVKDADIVCRRYLLIDLDRTTSRLPATVDEIEDINQVANSIERDLFVNNGLQPITVFSGNGSHIYLPINLPNDADSKILCQKMLQGLAKHYDTATVKVDTGVYNASRITKVPGTVARKGTEVPDPTGINERCYLMAQVAE